MDYAHFMGCCLLGFGPALAIFFLLRPKRRTRIPPLGWWLSLILGTVVCFYAMSQSTVPSFSTRITAVGRTYDYVQREIRSGYHHDTVYGFRLVPEGGKPIQIETEIILPGWADPAVFNGRTFRVVYLQDTTRALKNEAIEIEILSGEHSGYHESLDARPLGSWLGLPIGAAFASFGALGLRYKNDDAKSAASDENDDSSA
jgi:hypothetical protein